MYAPPPDKPGDGTYMVRGRAPGDIWKPSPGEVGCIFVPRRGCGDGSVASVNNIRSTSYILIGVPSVLRASRTIVVLPKSQRKDGHKSLFQFRKRYRVMKFHGMGRRNVFPLPPHVMRGMCRRTTRTCCVSTTESANIWTPSAWVFSTLASRAIEHFLNNRRFPYNYTYSSVWVSSDPTPPSCHPSARTST